MAKTNWTIQDILQPQDLNQLGEEVNKTSSQLDSHTGSRGDAHLAATTEEAGFMSPEDKKELATIAEELGEATSEPLANTLVKRAANGTFKAGAPVEGDDVARKADIADLSNATDEDTPNRIVKRDVNGQFKVGAPTDPVHVARKQDVDNVIDNVTLQLEDVLQKGASDSEIFNVITMVNEVDTRSVSITRADGLITKVEEKDGSDVLRTTTLTRDSSSNLTEITQVCNGITVTYTIQRNSDNQVESVTKTVSKEVQQ